MTSHHVAIKILQQNQVHVHIRAMEVRIILKLFKTVYNLNPAFLENLSIVRKNLVGRILDLNIAVRKSVKCQRITINFTRELF